MGEPVVIVDAGEDRAESGVRPNKAVKRVDDLCDHRFRDADGWTRRDCSSARWGGIGQGLRSGCHEPLDPVCVS